MKFGRTSAAAESIALAMAARLQLPSPLPLAESSVVRGGPLLVTWIPTATARVRARGYDQSRQIARSLARQIGCPIAPLLARSGQQRQVGHSRAERLAQLQAAYRPVKPWLIDGKDILLVDDVFTTGATLSAAAEQLHAAGARSVHAYVFARA
jgi:predicted amidophosphoribosyltransferase